MRIARAALHFFEEPVISGKRGSGTVFFSGCSLKCVFCQNRDISRAEVGKKISVGELCDIMLRLQDEGAHNINLVTPTHFVHKIAQALIQVKPRLKIPVAYNSSGYESTDTLRSLEGLIDIYMPDFKYGSSELAARYSYAPDYPDVAEKAIAEMHRQTGKYELDGEGMLKRGTLVRHLVLPSHRADSREALTRLSLAVPPNEILLSVMSQYTPEFAYDSEYKNLHRRITTFEYNSVLSVAEALGFDGFSQQRSSASDKYTPDFF